MKSNVIMVTLIGWFFLKETVGWRTWTGIFVGLMGVIVIFGAPSAGAAPIGYLLALLSAFFIALTYVAQKKLDAVHPPTYIALMCLPVAPLIMLSSIFIEGTQWTQDLNAVNWKIVGSVVFYQAIILSLSHMLWQRMIARMPLSQLVPWTLLIPVVALGTSVLFLHEPLTLTIIIGGLLTISGVGIVTFRKIKKNEPIALEK